MLQDYDHDDDLCDVSRRTKEKNVMPARTDTNRKRARHRNWKYKNVQRKFNQNGRGGMHKRRNKRVMET